MKRRTSWCAAVSLAAIVPAIGQSSQPAALNDLDAFMARVLERREENWKTLHDYVLDEVERFEIVSPGDVRLHGMNREFTWYVRDGYFVRSPVRFDGVALAEAERRRYEEEWLADERRREERRTRPADPSETKAEPAREPPVDPGSPSLEGFVGQRGEPRFVSEAYFLKFKFEPGNYYFAGRDEIEERDVVRIEYYPTRLFTDEGERAEGKKDERKKGEVDEREIERKLNKVAQVTLWIDPSEHQIVRYTFDNVDFGFLPGRWLVRVDEVRATMTMTRVFDGVWLPKAIDMRAGLSLANGSYRIDYGRRFSDYRKAEVRARIRAYDGRGR